MRNWKAWLTGAGTISVIAAALMSGGEIGEPDPAGKSASEIRIVQSAEIINAKPGDEIVSKRMANVKVYKIDNNTFTAKITQRPVHYLDPEDGLYKDPDLTVKDVSTEIKQDPKRLYDKYINPGNGLPKTTWFEGVPENYIFYHPGGDSVKYHTLFDTDSISVALVYEMETTKEFITLDDAGDGNSLSWIIETSANFKQWGNEIYYTDNKGNFLFRNPAPWAKDASGKEINIAVTLSGDTLTYKLDISESVTYPITVDPSTTVEAVLDGYMRTQSGQYTGGANTGARDTTESNVAGGGSMEVGQALAGAIYYNMRGQVLFPLPTELNIATVSACTLYLYLNHDNSATDFNMTAIKSTLGGPVTKAKFNDFNGWQTTGVYSPDTLIVYPAVSSNGLVENDFNAFPFGVAGIEHVNGIVNIADTLKMVLISEEDINNSAPTDQEYLDFAVSTGAGKEPYLGITYTQIEPENFAMEAIEADSMKFTWTDNYVGEDGYIIVSASDSNYAISDTLAADATEVTVGGLTPDSLYTCKVRVIDYTNGWYGMSASDNEATYPALPAGLAVVPSHQDTVHYYFSANGNPVTTTYAMAIIDSDSDTLWVDYSATPDTLKTSNGGIDSLYAWGWATRANIMAFSDSGLIYIPDYTGETLDYYMYSEGQDDGD